VRGLGLWQIVTTESKGKKEGVERARKRELSRGEKGR
jgi:hypothetical protein